MPKTMLIEVLWFKEYSQCINSAQYTKICLYRKTDMKHSLATMYIEPKRAWAIVNKAHKKFPELPNLENIMKKWVESKLHIIYEEIR